MTAMRYPDNTTQAFGYDGMGRQTSATDQAGRTTAKGYDDAGQLTSVTDALAQVTRYGYDAGGNLETQTDAEGRVTRYQWDRVNRRTRRTLPLGQLEQYGYDAVGNLTSRTDFAGRATAFTYDDLNRLLRKTPHASFFSAPTEYSYQVNGLRAAMTDASGTTNYSYDARNRLVTKATPQGVLTYGCDRRGNVVSMQSGNANGTWAEYGWDELNRVSSVIDRRLAVGTSTYSYDAVGNRARVAYPNGVTHEYGYDALDRLTSMPITTGSGAGTFRYTVGPAGHQLTATGLNGRVSTYGYDAIYRLVSESITADPTAANNGVIGYSYDKVGNRLAMMSTLGVLPGRSYTYDFNDRLGGETYDANGNTTVSGGYTYTYDFEDRLVAAANVAFTYDGDGHRVRKTVGANTTRYLIDDLNPTGYAQVVEEIVNGAVQRSYTYGLQRISQDWAPPSPTAHFYVYDGHGSVRALTDINGVVTDAYEYDAFGNLVAGFGNTANHNLYAGEHFDVDLGMYYLRARWYRPGIGRFLTGDVLESAVASQLSRYLYADSDPVNRIDPSGHFSVRLRLALGPWLLAKELVFVSLYVTAISCGILTLVAMSAYSIEWLNYKAGRQPEPKFADIPLSVKIACAVPTAQSLLKKLGKAFFDFPVPTW